MISPEYVSALTRVTTTEGEVFVPTKRRTVQSGMTVTQPLPTGGSLVFAAASDVAAAPPPSPAARAAPLRVGRYELRQRLGAGGMGEVHLAHDTELSREVAVKLLSTHLLADPQWLPRFRSEARAAGGLNHPNVITVHDVGEADGVPFLVTEYVAGTTLRQRLTRGRLTADEWRSIAVQVVAASPLT